MRLTRNARSSIPGTAWHSSQQPGPREERVPPTMLHGESHGKPGGHFGAGP